MKKTILLLLSGLCGLAAMAQVATQKEAQTVYHSYVTRNMLPWKQVIDSLEQLPTMSVEQRAALLNFEYGYVAWRLSKDNLNKKQANDYLDKAYRNLELLAQEGYSEALVAAYNGAFIGYQIALSPIKAPFIGMKSLKFVKEAVQADSTNYFASIQYGNVLYYMPGMFGGSRSKAIEHYNKAKQLMQEQGVHQNNWLYMNLLLTLADAYKKEKDWQQVKNCYDEALQLQPDYPYIMEQLYPTLLEKMQQ